MAVPLTLIAATPVGSSARTFGLSGFLLWYKDNLLITWFIVLIKCDFPHPSPFERSKWNGTGDFFPLADLDIIYDFALFYIKSKT